MGLSVRTGCGAEVDELRTRFGLPGMKVLQFVFDGSRDSLHLPRHHEQQSVVYTGTHGSDTTVAWWQHLDDMNQVRCCLSDPEETMQWG